MTQNSKSNQGLEPIAQATATTKASVVSGLGYPNGREESSQSPVGWQALTEEVTTIKKQVSRETSR